jgi:hypothetical protein
MNTVCVACADCFDWLFQLTHYITVNSICYGIEHKLGFAALKLPFY